MGFHWYIDIDEESTGLSFPRGPIVLQPNQPLKVPAFVEMVNAAFLNVYEDGIHDALYTMSARIQPMSGVGQETSAGTDHHHIDSAGNTLSHGPHANQPNNQPHGHINTKSNMTWDQNANALSTPTTIANNPRHDQARDARQFIVQYRIENTANRSFKISFYSGPHGSKPVEEMASGFGGGTPPRAQITATNTSNVQPLVLNHCKISAMITDKPPVPPGYVVCAL